MLVINTGSFKVNYTYWMAMRVPSEIRIKSYAVSFQHLENSQKFVAYRQAVNNDCPDRFINHVRQDTQGRRDGCVFARPSSRWVNVHWVIRTGLPVYVRSMNSILDLWNHIDSVCMQRSHSYGKDLHRCFINIQLFFDETSNKAVNENSPIEIDKLLRRPRESKNTPWTINRCQVKCPY